MLDANIINHITTTIQPHITHAYLTANSGANSGTTKITIPSPSDSSQVIGGSAIQTILGGLGYFVIALGGAGILISAIMLAVGKHSSNGRLHDRGREGLVAAIVALIVGGGVSAIANFAFNTVGNNINPSGLGVIPSTSSFIIHHVHHLVLLTTLIK